MAAISHNKGKIVMIGGVPHICVKLRNVWHWRPFNGISAKTFQTYKDDITNHLASPPSGNEQDWPLRISGASASANIINGEWIPIPTLRRNGEFGIYRKKDDEDKWFYCTKDNQNRFTWWIGVTSKATERKPWGFFKQLGSSAYSMKPWIIEGWRCWNPAPNAGRWMESSVVILPMSPETIYKEKVDEFIRTTKEEQITILAEAEKAIGEWKAVGNILFNQLTPQDRLTYIKKTEFQKLFKKENLCSCCFSSEKTTKCIHIDCPGACQKCRGVNEDNDCCACGKKQLLQCPVCQDDFPPSFVKRFNACAHCICWKCYGTAFDLKRRIKKCPMCRTSLNPETPPIPQQ